MTSFTRTFLPLIALFLVGAPPDASAFLEIKGTAGQNQAKPGDLNDTFVKYPNGTINQVTTIGGDVMLELPLIPFGFGARYESFIAGRDDGSGNSSYLRGSRTSALIDYRFVDTVIYFGPIGSVGLSHSFDIATDINGKHLGGKPGGYSSWSGGLEFGIKALYMIVGVEAGYTSMIMTEIKQPDGTYMLGPGKTVDISGTYAKVSAGFAF